MMKLGEIADVVRSKNAGIYRLTIDVMFEDAETYERVKATGDLSAEVFAELYDLPLEDVQYFEYDPGLAFKITIPARVSSGSPGDTDLRGAQQHAPVFDLEVDVDGSPS
ncbi:DUF4387 domain-containing protein [Salinigranum halophilum]|uniref:DUF4387 domain-containing protein n=1 Tax=Salinigranum halophilum TaxID=2565931 RepID=UPI0010A795CA|nr:DUF4387 domain-containing protein [Salinigranum halophilum]